jgi:hypothetical protein
VKVAWIYHRETAFRYYLGTLSSDKARRIANATARLPELLIQHREFFQRGPEPAFASKTSDATFVKRFV